MPGFRLDNGNSRHCVRPNCYLPLRAWIHHNDRLAETAACSLAIREGPYAVHACMAFGFWLATLRHQAATAAAHTRHYAEGIADAPLSFWTRPRNRLRHRLSVSCPGRRL
jgi:hypothetical protein